MELLNSLTKSRADDLYSSHPLAVSFSHTDISGGSLVIGTCPVGRVISEIVVEIISAFNGGVTLTVGDSTAQGRLLTSSDVKTTQVARYKLDVDYTYSSSTELSVYFPSGTPTVGSGKITIYLA